MDRFDHAVLLGMTYAERVRFINTYKTASTTAPYKPQFDALMLQHQTLFFSGQLTIARLARCEAMSVIDQASTARRSFSPGTVGTFCNWRSCFARSTAVSQVCFDCWHGFAGDQMN